MELASVCSTRRFDFKLITAENIYTGCFSFNLKCFNICILVWGDDLYKDSQWEVIRAGISFDRSSVSGLFWMFSISDQLVYRLYKSVSVFSGILFIYQTLSIQTREKQSSKKLQVTCRRSVQVGGVYCSFFKNRNVTNQHLNRRSYTDRVKALKLMHAATGSQCNDLNRGETALTSVAGQRPQLDHLERSDWTRQ